MSETILNHIIEGCKKNKRFFQAELYNIFSKKMFGICLYYSKDYTEAQDILQDGFIKVFEKINQFENKGSFEGWMRKIFVNTALERFRKKKLLFSLDNETEIPAETETVEFESSLNAQELLNIIKELTPQYKMVFNLYSIEGYNHKEIGKMLNISEGTSKSNLARARKILQAKINEKYCERKVVKLNAL